MSDRIRITYAGTDYWMDGSEASRRAVAQIEQALAGGGSLVALDHDGGRVQIAVSPGVPLSVEYVPEIEALGVY